MSFLASIRDFTGSVTDLWVGLLTQEPTLGTAELSGSGYARQQNTAWQVDSAGVVKNTQAIAFGPATAAWSEVTHLGLFDASTGGTLVGWSKLTGGVDVAQDAFFQIRRFELTNGVSRAGGPSRLDTQNSVTMTAPEVWRFLGQSGQSNSVGATTTAETLAQQYDNVQPNVAGDGVIPLVEGEVEVGAGMHDTETGKATLGNVYRQMIGSGVVGSATAGGGGLALSALRLGTTLFTLGITQLTAVRAAAIAAGAPFSHDGQAWDHGETDFTDSNASYGTELTAYQAEYETASQGVTGDTARVPLYVSQMSSYAVETGGINIPLQMLDAHEADPAGIVITQPAYQDDFNDRTHKTATSVKRTRAKHAQVAYIRQVLGQDWRPLSPTLIEAKGSVVDVTFNVPVPPLKFDLETVLEQNDGNLGFEIVGADTNLRILAVAIISPTVVRLYTNGAPQVNDVINYGFSDATGAIGGAYWVDSPRGNLRDSDLANQGVFSGFGGLPTENWCLHFSKPITTQTATDPGYPAQPASDATHSVQGAVNRFVSFPIQASLQPGSAATWRIAIKIDADPGSSNIFEIRGGSGLFSVRCFSGEIRMLFGSSSNTAITQDGLLAKFGTGRWVVLAGTYSAANGYKLVSNHEGVVQNRPLETSGSPPASITGATTPFYIGSPNGVNQGPADTKFSSFCWWPGQEATYAQLHEIALGPIDPATSSLGAPPLYIPFRGTDDLEAANSIANEGTLGGNADANNNHSNADLTTESP